MSAVIVPVSANAVEFDTVIAASGLLSVLPRVQRIKMGAERAGRLAHVWADEHSVHVLIGGELVKTVASNLSATDLHELRLRGAAKPRLGPDSGTPARRRTDCRPTAGQAGSPEARRPRPGLA
jgi:hypothetical protein